MTDREIKIVIGALLHDVGKVIFRQGSDRRNHSQSGYDFLKEEVQIEDQEILNCIRFHHAQAMKNAKIPENDISYIVYIADNIASAVDRRENDTEDKGFELSTPLQSVFGILNGKNEEQYYRPLKLNPNGEINNPQKEKEPFTKAFYDEVRLQLVENLKGLDWNQEYINSLLSVLEANLTYVPSSTAKGERADISLYDHVKVTAAIASCISQYLEEEKITDYRKTLFQESRKFYEEKAFLLFSMDVSGIQDFIYTIATKNALKTLRTRSFYLEIMMEHIIDELLERLHLSRANLIYSGGGHCYLLLPNTNSAKNTWKKYLQEVNAWFVKYYKTALYIAGADAECSSNILKNEPKGSYSDLFRRLSAGISKRKSSRYQAQEIIKMNARSQLDYTRECKVCKSIGKVDEEGVCETCRTIEKFSKDILYQQFFTVLTESKEKGLPLPGNCVLVPDTEKSLRKRMQEDPCYVRTYSKNEMYTGRHVATKLWVGDYTTGSTMEDFAKQAQGIGRIGILRADVDNLGTAFVSGFSNEKNNDRYVTLSRTATLSRQLSLFFKLHINQILEKKKFKISETSGKGRFATIVYSGGDDVFIVGSWNEIIELAIDLRRALETYTQGTLTISAGIGIYGASYPISAIAEEVADLEDESKGLPGKNAVTLLEDGCYHSVDYGEDSVFISDGTCSWKEFEEKVIGEKLKVIESYLTSTEEKGNALLYHILELIRNQNQKINFARYVYLLSRLEPEKDAPEERKESYQKFSTKMYQWIKSEEDCRQLKMAITLFVYLNREKGEEV